MSLVRSILRTWGASLGWFLTAAVTVVLLAHVPDGMVQTPRAARPPIADPAPSAPGESFIHQPIDLIDPRSPRYTWQSASYMKAVRHYTGGLFHGNLVFTAPDSGGKLQEYHVLPMIREAWIRSLLLFIVTLPGGFLIGLLLGPLGVHWRRLRLTATAFAMGGLSVPDYCIVVFGQVLTIFCYRQFGFRLWSVGVPGGDRQWVLPMISLTIPVAAMVTRLTTTALAEIMGQDYVRTARSMGIPEWRVVLFHAMRNALPRILAALPTLVNMTLSSLVIVELLSSWGGIGRYVIPSGDSSLLLVGVESALVATGALVFCGCFTLLNALANTVRLLANPQLAEVGA